MGNCIAKLFGELKGGKKVTAYTITNKNGMEATFINYGATITSLKLPAVNETVDVVLGFDNLAAYEAAFGLPSAPYFGSVIGRYAGRIANAKFTLNEKEYSLAANNGANTLHGGNTGFGRAFWEATDIQTDENPSITFEYTSPAGEENFPGDLAVKVTYTLTEANELTVQYWATTTEDTVLNLTQHSYFNLEGHSQSISNQKLFINSHKALETKPDNVPTGHVLDVANCPFDFTQTRNCPQRIDNSFVIEDAVAPAASLFSEKTGLKMTVYTNQPSVHIYVGGNCFGQIAGKENAQYHTQSGICFEAQNYPDAPNQPLFPNSVLKKGEEYYQITRFKFEDLNK
jgi:aldose 1-epimerase